MTQLLPWIVCSPEYGEIVPITDEGQGPMEYGCDVVHVEAATKLDALLLGVMLFQQQGAKYLDDAESPYAGVRVQSAVCPDHGLATVQWSGEHGCYLCSVCEAAWEAIEAVTR